MYQFRALVLLIAGNFATSTFGAGPYGVQWQQSFGGTGDDVLLCARPLTAGGYILAGYSSSPASTTNGNKSAALLGIRDAWLVRIDDAGTKVWDRSYGGTNFNAALGCELTSDGGFLLAGVSTSPASGNKTSAHHGGQDFWVLRLNSNGNPVWDRSFGGAQHDFARVARQTPDGGYIVGGYSDSAISGNKTNAGFGGGDYWLVRLNSTGNKSWERSYGGTNLDELTSLQLTSDGGFIVGGYSESPPSGNKTAAYFGGRDFWVVRLDSNGLRLWDRSYGASSRDELRTLQPTSDGGFILGGYSAAETNGNRTAPKIGFSDFWLAKIDAAGNLVWDSAAGGMDFQGMWDAHQASDGEFVTGGFSISGPDGNKTSPSFGGTDYWLVCFDSQGAKVWDASFGGRSADDMYAIRRALDGGLIVGGSSASPSGGTGNKTSAAFGGHDFWVLKLLPNPRLSTFAQTAAAIQQSGFRFTLHGVSNLNYVVDFSTNLLNWTPLRTNRLTSSSLQLSNSVAADPHRFYRARIQP